MFAGIPVAFLATALPFNLCLICSHVLKDLICRVGFVRAAQEFQIEISTNSSFEQGENVTFQLMEMKNEIQMSKAKWQTKFKCLNAKGPEARGQGPGAGD